MVVMRNAPESEQSGEASGAKTLERLKVTELKKALRARGLSQVGSKKELKERLTKRAKAARQSVSGTC